MQESTNVVCDIIVPPSTNRVTVIRNWGETQLVLFKLQHAAIAGSIEAKYFNYSSASVQELKLSRTNYLNAVWAFFNGWDGEDTKCEFKYIRDYSKTNIQAVSVTTNTVIFDGSVQFPIP